MIGGDRWDWNNHLVIVTGLGQGINVSCPMPLPILVGDMDEEADKMSALNQAECGLFLFRLSRKEKVQFLKELIERKHTVLIMQQI